MSLLGSSSLLLLYSRELLRSSLEASILNGNLAGSDVILVGTIDVDGLGLTVSLDAALILSLQLAHIGTTNANDARENTVGSRDGTAEVLAGLNELRDGLEGVLNVLLLTSHIDIIVGLHDMNVRLVLLHQGLDGLALSTNDEGNVGLLNGNDGALLVQLGEDGFNLSTDLSKRRRLGHKVDQTVLVVQIDLSILGRLDLLKRDLLGSKNVKDVLSHRKSGIGFSAALRQVLQESIVGSLDGLLGTNNLNLTSSLVEVNLRLGGQLDSLNEEGRRLHQLLYILNSKSVLAMNLTRNHFVEKRLSKLHLLLVTSQRNGDSTCQLSKVGREVQMSTRLLLNLIGVLHLVVNQIEELLLRKSVILRLHDVLLHVLLNVLHTVVSLLLLTKDHNLSVLNLLVLLIDIDLHIKVLLDLLDVSTRLANQDTNVLLMATGTLNSVVLILVDNGLQLGLGCLHSLLLTRNTEATIIDHGKDLDTFVSLLNLLHSTSTEFRADTNDLRRTAEDDVLLEVLVHSFTNVFNSLLHVLLQTLNFNDIRVLLGVDMNRELGLDLLQNGTILTNNGRANSNLFHSDGLHVELLDPISNESIKLGQNVLRRVDTDLTLLVTINDRRHVLANGLNVLAFLTHEAAHTALRKGVLSHRRLSIVDFQGGLSLLDVGLLTTDLAVVLLIHVELGGGLLLNGMEQLALLVHQALDSRNSHAHEDVLAVVLLHELVDELNSSIHLRPRTVKHQGTRNILKTRNSKVHHTLLIELEDSAGLIDDLLGALAIGTNDVGDDRGSGGGVGEGDLRMIRNVLLEESLRTGKSEKSLT